MKTLKYKVCKKGHLKTPDNTASNGSCKECKRLYDVAYYAENRDVLLKKSLIYDASHRKERREYYHKHTRTLRCRYEKLKSYCRTKNLSLSLSFEDWARLVASPCYYCGGPLPAVGYGLDQVIPRSGYTLENVQPCCKRCNTAKSNQSPTEFYKWVKLVYKRMKLHACIHRVAF
jgi:5-methylcytosine-specific restriction endonuclease McrA